MTGTYHLHRELVENARARLRRDPGPRRVDHPGGIGDMLSSKAMTIGQLARRAGVSIKILREYEQLGLIYTLGRSESNYRLFDEEALWCIQVIAVLRSLGLTLKEIQDISTFYCRRPGDPIGPHLARKLDQALSRIEVRIGDLETVRRRILEFQMTHATALAGQSELALYASDPRRLSVESAS